MKRILLIAALAGLFLTNSGCSNGFLRGGLINGCNDGCNTSSGGLFSGNLMPSGDLFKDGPVRQWLRGDACDTCNVPAGQITYDSGFDSSCESGLCGTTAPVISAPYTVSDPIISQPATNYYPSFDEGTVNVNSVNIDGVSEDQFFDGDLDSIELPPINVN